MPVPWLRILDAVIGVTDLARSRRIRTLAKEGSDEQHALETSARGLGGLEARLAGVVVAALKEAFDRDTRRLELERQQIEAERQRAERALALELLRQAGDREIGRLRLLAAASVATWLGTLFLAARVIGGGVGPRVTLGCGWALLLAAIAASFAGQARVARALEQVAESGSMPRDAISSSAAGALAPWLVIGGLALVGFAALIA